MPVSIPRWQEKTLWQPWGEPHVATAFAHAKKLSEDPPGQIKAVCVKPKQPQLRAVLCRGGRQSDGFGQRGSRVEQP